MARQLIQSRSASPGLVDRRVRHSSHPGCPRIEEFQPADVGIRLSQRPHERAATRRRSSDDVTKARVLCEGGASDFEEIQVVLRRRAPLVAGVATALCLSAAGCTPSGPATPSPTPTPSASPTETQLQRQTRLDYEAAEKSYRTFSTEVNRLANAGGAEQPSQVMKETASGPLLKAFSEALRNQHEAKARWVGKSSIDVVQRGGYSPTLLTLDTCEDGSKMRAYDSSGKLIGKGYVAWQTVEVHRIDGRWKAWDTTESRKVASCAP